MKRLAAVLVTLLFAATACTSTPSGATCPPDNAPSYQSFGANFMSTYCTGCHSRNATSRHGAPADQNYDTEADVIAHAADIDAAAAAGPNATNTAMPDMSGPVHTRPTDEERQLLGQYLACQQ